MQYKVVTAVATEPVSLAEARLQCKVSSDDTTHDATLTALIAAAREYAEHYTGRALAEQTLEAAFDAFPCEAWIDVPLGPVASVTSVKYTDTAGVEQTLSSSLYALSTYNTSRRINLAYAAIWPSTQCIANAVRVRYVTGYGVTLGPVLPKAVKSALLLHIEMESPLNALTPSERESMERAIDCLLDTVKDYG